MNLKQLSVYNLDNPMFPLILFDNNCGSLNLRRCAELFVLNCILCDELVKIPTVRATVLERLTAALEIAAQQQGFNGLPFEVEGKLISQVLQELKAKGVITNCVAGNRSWYLKDTAKQLMLRSSKYNNLYAVK